MDVDKDSREETDLAEGSQMLLISDKMLLGSKNKDTKSKLLQLSSDKVGIFATTTAEMQQGEAKAVVTLNSEKAVIGSSENKMAGNIVVVGDSDFKGEIKSPSGNIDVLSVGTSFSSPNISDGMGPANGTQPEKPKGELKEEEAAS